MKYVDKEHTAIQDGNRSIPVNPDNRHYQEILKSGVRIDPYASPPVEVPEPTLEETLIEAEVITRTVLDAARIALKTR